MSDLISRSKLLEKLPYISGDDSNNHAIWTICHEPEVDAVEVVRCKDCKHWQSGKIGWCEINSSYNIDGTWNGYYENDFCSYGERR